MSQCQTHPCQQVFSFTAAVEGAERSGWMMQVAVKVLVQPHHPFLLFVRLVDGRKLWTGGTNKEILAHNERKTVMT